MEAKMATKRAIDAIQPDIPGAYMQFFSFHKLFPCKTYMHYEAISHTHDLKKGNLFFQHNLKSKMATNMVGAI